MQRTYTALTGVEIATAIAKMATRLALGIPGLSSRLTTFPLAKVTITVRLECFDHHPSEVEDMDELIERTIAEQMAAGENTGLQSLGTREYSVTIDESEKSTDEIRREAGIPVTQPTLLPGGQIVDKPVEADPLPAGENLSNITPFGTFTGRVIEQETVGIGGASPITQKLKGDPQASHFRVRQP